MAGLFSKPANATQPQQLNSINIDRSRYGDPVPIVFGMQRIPITLLWYGDFTSTAVKSGKGGSGGNITGYAYTASVVMGLCESDGTVQIRQIWKDKAITTLETEELIFFPGGTAIHFTAPLAEGATSGTVYGELPFSEAGPLNCGITFSDGEYRYATIDDGVASWVGGLTAAVSAAVTLGVQAPWSYLTTNFPGQNVPYDHTAYLAEAGKGLGNTAALPNYSFEAQSFLSQPGETITFTTGLAAGATSAATNGSPVPDGVWDITFSDDETRSCTFATSGGVTQINWDTTNGLQEACTDIGIVGGYDAEPSAIWMRYATDINFGADFPYTNPNCQGSGPTWQTYNIANGIMISPWEDTQRPASDFLKDLLTMTNSNCVMSAGQLVIFPYGDAPISANGVTYEPNLTPLFAFTDLDYVPAGTSTDSTDPVVLTRKPLTETFNVERIQFNDRSNNYNPSLGQWEDDLDIAVNGIRCDSNKTFAAITVGSVAVQVATLIGQRQLYIRNEYEFGVRADVYTMIEPGDLCSVTDAGLGLNNVLMRVTKTEDDDENKNPFVITVEEMFVGTASAPKYNFEAAQGYYANYAAEPPSVAAPLIFSVPPALVGPSGGYQLDIAVGPAIPTGAQSHEYGGCNIYGCLDNITFSYLGTLIGQSLYGTLVDAIGATDTAMSVVLNPEAAYEDQQLLSASADDYANNRALIFLDGEIIGFEVATLTDSPGQYNVNPISRGLFGTTAVAHAAGAPWARINSSIFNFPFDPGMMGKTLYLKFCAFNEVMGGVENLADVAEYEYVIENFNAGQLLAGPLTLEGIGVGIVGTSVFKTATTEAWDSGAWSLQGYVNGAFVAFQPADTVSSMMVGLHHATGVVDYADLDFMMFCSAGVLKYSENSIIGALAASYAVGDDLQVTYDGNIVRYVQNGTVLRQVAVGSGRTCYLASSFYTPNAKVTSLAIGGNGGSSPILFNARGSCTVSDGSAQKLADGSLFWDSDVYSINGYPTCNVVWKGSQIGGAVMVGLIQQPMQNAQATGEGNYSFLPYAIYLQDDGIWTVYESGAPVPGLTGSYDETTLFAITYDGSTVGYHVDGVEVGGAGITGATFFVDACFYTPGAAINSLDFGPGATIPLTDTGQLGANAATNIFLTQIAGPVDIGDGYNGTPAASVTVPAQSTDCEVVITSTFTVNNNAPSDEQTVYALLTTVSEYSFLDSGNNNAVSYAPAGTAQDNQGCALEETFTQAAGVAQTYYLLASFDNFLPSGGLYNPVVKAEIIKR